MKKEESVKMALIWPKHRTEGDKPEVEVEDNRTGSVGRRCRE